MSYRLSYATFSVHDGDMPRLGRPSEGVALIRQGIESLVALGTHIDF